MITGLPIVSALKRAMSDFNRHGMALPAPMTPFSAIATTKTISITTRSRQAVSAQAR